jgi:hypothetical protein
MATFREYIAQFERDMADELRPQPEHAIPDGEQSPTVSTINIYDIILANRQNGLFFFEASALRFFNSRYAQTATLKGNLAYFVTSEQFVNGSYKAHRLFTVRCCNMTTGHINTVGKFQQFSSRYPANATIKHIANTTAPEAN